MPRGERGSHPADEAKTLDPVKVLELKQGSKGAAIARVAAVVAARDEVFDEVLAGVTGCGERVGLRGLDIHGEGARAAEAVHIALQCRLHEVERPQKDAAVLALEALWEEHLVAAEKLAGRRVDGEGGEAADAERVALTYDVVGGGCVVSRKTR